MWVDTLQPCFMAQKFDSGKQRRKRPGRDGRREARSKIAVAPKDRIPIYNKQKPAHGQPCAGFAMERRDIFGLHNAIYWFT